eukprot:3189160-Amphidinium_carterae.1
MFPSLFVKTLPKACSLNCWNWSVFSICSCKEQRAEWDDPAGPTAAAPQAQAATPAPQQDVGASEQQEDSEPERKQ